MFPTGVEACAPNVPIGGAPVQPQCRNYSTLSVADRDRVNVDIRMLNRPWSGSLKLLLSLPVMLFVQKLGLRVAATDYKRVYHFVSIRFTAMILH